MEPWVPAFAGMTYVVICAGRRIVCRTGLRLPPDGTNSVAADHELQKHDEFTRYGQRSRPSWRIPYCQQETQPPWRARSQTKVIPERVARMYTSS